MRFDCRHASEYCAWLLFVSHSWSTEWVTFVQARLVEANSLACSGRNMSSQRGIPTIFCHTVPKGNSCPKKHGTGPNISHAVPTAH